MHFRPACFAIVYVVNIKGIARKMIFITSYSILTSEKLDMLQALFIILIIFVQIYSRCLLE